LLFRVNHVHNENKRKTGHNNNNNNNNNNSILHYLCAEAIATRPITDIAQHYIMDKTT
jgi:hypothetical protein